MSSLKTLVAGALIIASMANVARAQDDLVLLFAGCTGRMSAEMEFAWLVGDARGDDLQVQRQRFVSVLDAVMPPDRAREALNHRIEVKLAHLAFLTTAFFGTDDRMARLARDQARVRVETCRTLLLDG